MRKIDTFDALELRYAMDGRAWESRLYRGAEIRNLKPDADKKREELAARGWTDATTQEPRP